MLLHLICSVKVIHVLVNEFTAVLLIAPAATHPLHVWFCVRRAVLRLLRLGFTPSKSCDSPLKTHSEITLNITGRKICMSQQKSSTHLLHLSLSTPPVPFPSLLFSYSSSSLFSHLSLSICTSFLLPLPPSPSTSFLMALHALPLPLPSSFSSSSPNPSSPP